MSQTYRVTWEIEIDADSARDAADLAFRCMQAPTTATVFDVTDEAGQTERVDLLSGTPWGDDDE